jgi:hydroxyacylglutathione hydrolase
MTQSQTSNAIIVEAIRAFSDNYIWKIVSADNKQVVLVDPGDADVCINNIESHQQQIIAILITHHHADHTGGVKQLVDYAAQKKWPINVYGPKTEQTPCNTVRVNDQNTVAIPELSLNFRVIDLPGHTLGHIAYYGDNMLFSGDTLFSGGCGRLFEGSPEQMFDSLQKLARLPKNTRVYCTHEYTLANLGFALTVDTNNQRLKDYQQQVLTLRSNDQISLPTTIEQELAINPFLRCHHSDIRYQVSQHQQIDLANDIDTFAALRRWKDNF